VGTLNTSLSAERREKKAQWGIRPWGEVNVPARTARRAQSDHSVVSVIRGNAGENRGGGRSNSIVRVTPRYGSQLSEWSKSAQKPRITFRFNSVTVSLKKSSAGERKAPGQRKRQGNKEERGEGINEQVGEPRVKQGQQV